MKFDSILKAVAAGRKDPDTLADLAGAALAEAQEEVAIPLIAAQARPQDNARLWQWLALLQRSLDEHRDALASFERAAALAPQDAGIAHGRARVALEAGLSAVDLFEEALALAPSDRDMLLGLAAAQFAQGQGEAAERALDSALATDPMWIQGHVQLAQLRSMLGKKEAADDSLNRALRQRPQAEQLWVALFDIAIRSKDFEGLDRAVAHARSAGIGNSTLLPFESIAAAETSDIDRADRLFSKMPSNVLDSIGVWRVRHLLRSGRCDLALPIIDRTILGRGAASIWPYASIAWRLAGDPRWDWLEKDERFVSVLDLTAELPPMSELASFVRGLHEGMGQYLDQSVRGGSQTDGPLFSRIDPQVRAVRSAVVRAIQSHVSQLPPPDPRHPLLAPRRDRTPRFSGSWSVRLRGGGHHTSHVHPQGWISSAFYVSLPDEISEQRESKGWLTLGEPPEDLGLNLSPERKIAPREGRLILFPSWMWHGTIPFDSGERITIAFDVRVPN